MSNLGVNNNLYWYDAVSEDQSAAKLQTYMGNEMNRQQERNSVAQRSTYYSQSGFQGDSEEEAVRGVVQNRMRSLLQISEELHGHKQLQQELVPLLKRNSATLNDYFQENAPGVGDDHGYKIRPSIVAITEDMIHYRT